MNNFKILFLLLFIITQMFVLAQNDEKEKIRNQILSNIDSLELAKLKSKIEIKDKSGYQEATQIMQSKGYPIKYTDSLGTVFEFKGMLNRRPIYNKTYNRVAAQTTSTDDVWSSPFNLDGSGIEIGLWDGGAADEYHMSFREGSYGQKHVFFVDSTGSTINAHSTHVAGTIAADNDDYNSKGMAYKSIIYSMDSKHDEVEMINAAWGNDPNFSVPLILSNHSYGVDVGWAWADHRGAGTNAWYWEAENNQIEDPWFGDYNQITYDKDAIAYQLPTYTIVWAAGNDRGEGPEDYTEHYYWDTTQEAWVLSTNYHPKDGGTVGYDCLPPDAVCKNLITVGAIDDIVSGYQNSSNVKQDNTNFSVWGPTNDGRIKPDIVANGDGMKKLLLFFILLTIQLFSQGKILSKENADQLFGPVLMSKEIPTETLKMYTNQSVNVIMFKLMNNDIYILDNNRNALLPLGATINSSEVFSMYSIAIVQQLLSDGNNPFTAVEKRKDVLTITNGLFALEYSLLCPPFCPD